MRPWIKVLANSEFEVFDSQMREPEDTNFSNPIGDSEMRRTNPNRYDKRKDWMDMGKNETGKDDEMSGRTTDPSLWSGASKVAWVDKPGSAANAFYDSLPFVDPSETGYYLYAATTYLRKREWLIERGFKPVAGPFRTKQQGEQAKRLFPNRPAGPGIVFMVTNENLHNPKASKSLNIKEGKMRNWREVLGASYDITKKDVEEAKTVKPYDGKMPNNAEFSGDKFPDQGDPAKGEVKDWKEQNKRFDKYRKKEIKDTSHGSPLMADHVNVEETDEREASKSNWRTVLSNVQVEKKPDGTVKVNVEEAAQPSMQQPGVQAPVQPTEEENPNATGVEASKREWEIKKQGSLTLVGRECCDNAAVAILKEGKEVELYKVAKQGHTWEELIPRGVWESKLDQYK